MVYRNKPSYWYAWKGPAGVFDRVVFENDYPENDYNAGVCDSAICKAPRYLGSSLVDICAKLSSLVFYPVLPHWNFPGCRFGFHDIRIVIQLNNYCIDSIFLRNHVF